MISVIALSFQLLAYVLLLPWLVFFLSFMLTIGHWENEQYRKPALLLTVSLLFCFAVSTGVQKL